MLSTLHRLFSCGDVPGNTESVSEQCVSVQTAGTCFYRNLFWLHKFKSPAGGHPFLVLEW